MNWLDSWGRFVHRHRGFVLAMSLLVAVPCVALFPLAGELLKPGTPNPNTESGQGALLIEEQVPAAQDQVLAIILSQPGQAWPSDAFQENLAELEHQLLALDDVVSVVPPGEGGPGFVSRDATYVLLLATLEEGADPYAAYESVQFVLASSPLESVVTGEVAVDYTMGTLVGQDLAKAELVSLPLALIVLLIVFGAVVAALLPLLVGALAVACGVAVALAMANVVDVPDYAIQIVSLIGLGVAIDYSLFIVKRFREELEAGASREDALAGAVGHAGHAVLFSGLTVAASLGGLAFFHGTELAGVGVAIFAVVLLAVVQALLLLPAILAFLGHRVNKLRIPRQRTKRPVWAAIAQKVMQHPVAYLVLALAILLPLAVPLAGIQLGGFSIQQLPQSEEARRGFDILQSEFPNQGAAEVAIVLHWGQETSWRSQLEDASEFVGRVEAVGGHAYSKVSWNPEWSHQEHVDAMAQPRTQWPPEAQRVARTHIGDGVVVVTLYSDEAEDSPAVKDLVRAVREIPAPAGVDVYVSGMTATNLDKAEIIKDRLPLALAWIAGATLVLIALQTRSLILPVKALAMNTLSIAASFGAMVLVFQHGWGAEFLDFTPGPLVFDSLVIMGCIMFGLSMDYEVLLMGRIREEYLRTGDNAAAVRHGLARTGLVITGAALIMVCVFGAFGLVRLAFIKMIGIGLAFAVLLDATVVRALLVPSFMRLMGRWNWWPSKSGAGAVAPLPPSENSFSRTTRANVRPRFADPAVQAWFEEVRSQDADQRGNR